MPDTATPAAPPTVLAVIPARGGSKGVPAKNLASVAGVPLVARAVRACLGARNVTHVVVSTDDSGIAAAARTAGAEAVARPAAIAGDTATSEAAVLHAMDAFEAGHGRAADVVLLVQCTSPFLTSAEIAETVERITSGAADTAFTAAPSHGFLWRDAPDGSADGATGVNHDKAHRPRRQDREPEYLETGAVYAMDAAGFRSHEHRFFGRTALVVTDPARVLEIDDPHDLARARALAPLLDTPATPGFADVDAVVLDFDGTQTDDRVHLDAEGREFVSAHRGDGLGIAALRRAGLPVLILSTEQNAVVAARARKLKIPVLHGIDRKDRALKEWCEAEGIDPQRVLYAGNDVNDLPCFHLVGWPVAVSSAHDSVRAAARAVTVTPGGSGAIREIAAWLLGPELNTPHS
ncbi:MULTISPECIES: acylneuraminate cytidylyltransferase [Streptomyces]|uniref:N-acylneuraminate cytidylyltransferase n=1 Tax=Streptomyces venezuelae (strain ATCC 10712 / CBS 650.69 / DSM 40230 / JCM 4526 / NBRC 13096 / PD 04745) TaxID=953739 RepID=F2RL76_STRVP|nr:acylneuraminate cytidylyltransferase [Streptomyces venezuelae]APE23510.1 transferase [Streptomyces venezuelae]QES00882.1 acylneuraminate cytidylyltransferase [Streptomyces venezuelae ATCC 10712]CCA57835.1 N-Acetylneuraminate cytidylyltransferase [Streptomyces venezuelae ATCC 10712]